MEAKQRAIIAAYGDAWEKVKDCLSYPDAWCPESVVHWKEFTNDIYAVDHTADEDLNNYWRPRSLSGIMDNNGWIRLDEKEPTLGDYYVCRDGEFDGGILHSHEIMLPGNPYEVTHWRLIERPRPPLY